jgi:hypothetical protein
MVESAKSSSHENWNTNCVLPFINQKVTKDGLAATATSTDSAFAGASGEGFAENFVQR